MIKANFKFICVNLIIRIQYLKNKIRYVVHDENNVERKLILTKES